MRYPFVWLFLGASLNGCSCHPTASDLKKIASQRQQLQQCTTKTVLESFAQSNPPRENVEAFAEEFANRAPASNKATLDKEYLDYMGKYGCDPKKVGNSVGNNMVAEWFVSSHNPGLLSLLNQKLNMP